MPSRPTRLVAAAALAAALALPGAATAASPDVTIADLEFSPATVTVTAGDRVTWTNNDSTWHTASRAEWATGLILSGATGSITFATAGTFTYQCAIHPSMRGTVVVQSALRSVTRAEPTLRVPASDSTVASSTGGPGGPSVAVLGILALAGLAGLGLGLRRLAVARVPQEKQWVASSPRQRGPRP
jgi:plastocyanin